MDRPAANIDDTIRGVRRDGTAAARARLEDVQVDGVMGKSDPADTPEGLTASPVIEGISAISLATHDMARAVAFYRALGFDRHSGGEEAADVDAVYKTALAAGLRPDDVPRDAP